MGKLIEENNPNRDTSASLTAVSTFCFICLKVLVHFYEERGVCSVAHNRGKYQQVVQVESRSSRSVPFVVIFTKAGQHRIQVKAAVKDSSLHDGIQKNIQVLVSKHAL